MEYEDFYDIALYGNEAWKGCFSPKEIATNAYDYKMDFDYSKETGTLAPTMFELLKLLDEDSSEEAKDWAFNIRKELNITE